MEVQEINNMLIAITGGDGTGKSTIAKELLNKFILNEIESPFEIVSFGDAVNTCYKTITGIDFRGLDRKRKEQERQEFVQFAEYLKLRNQNIWVNALLRKYNPIDGKQWIVEDLRFPNELVSLFTLPERLVIIELDAAPAGVLKVLKNNPDRIYKHYRLSKDNKNEIFIEIFKDYLY